MPLIAFNVKLCRLALFTRALQSRRCWQLALGTVVILGPFATRAASLTPLGDLPNGNFGSGATGVSADGNTVVGFGTPADGNEAFRWTAAGGMIGLGNLGNSLPGNFGSAARGVSADSDTVVGYGTSASGNQAFLWTAAGGMIGLGDLPGGAFESGAYGVSADSNTVVGVSNSTSLNSDAFVWTAATGMKLLFTAPIIII